MFRISQFMQEIRSPTPLRQGPRVGAADAAVPTSNPAAKRSSPGPVVIWNLIRRCNLTCKHCYSISADHNFPGELDTAEVFGVMDDLRSYGVRALILSGGEPLLRPDIFDISRRAKAMGFYVGLSTNGTLIDDSLIGPIAAIGYDYVGISLDGIGATHDRFRRKEGAFASSIQGMRLCKAHGIKVGMRFTMTQDNAAELPQMLDLLDAEGIDKFYFSHLNYAGRGNVNRKDDAMMATTRLAMDTLFDRAWDYANRGLAREFVSGNNDADGVYLLFWVQKHFPALVDHIRAKLVQWGGNSSGVNIANIDNLGNVHPDTMWWHYNLGNVRERPFSAIWNDTSDPIMAGLRRVPRLVEGRCGSCRHFDICGGNTRVRAYQLTGNAWAEDPACYLDDQEIGLAAPGERLTLTPYTRRRRTGS